MGLFIAALGVTTALGIVESEDPGEVVGWVISVCMILGGIILPWLLAFRPRVILGETTVSIVNPLRTISIPLDRVTRTPRAGYYGVTIVVREDGEDREVTAWALQKSNLASWFGREVRADLASQAIAAASEAARRRDAVN